MTPEAFVFIVTLLFRSSEPPKPPLFGSTLTVTVQAEDERACNHDAVRAADARANPVRVP